MTDRPIIFSAHMIRALLDGRKTQTRRVLKVQPPEGAKFFAWDIGPAGAFASFIKPDVRGNADLYPSRLTAWRGDRLWVKEVWNAFTFSEDGECAWPTDKIPTADEVRDIRDAAYRFDVQAVYRESDRARKWFADQKWRSPIHMPRWASRLTLIVTDVRVQRLLDISEADAVAEGVEDGGCTECGGSSRASPPCCYRPSPDFRDSFAFLWNSLHGPDAWAANPWVCALTFTVHKCNIDQMGAKP
jgi:hypothetical protein